MSPTGDHSDEMRTQAMLEDHEIAALLEGKQADLRADLRELAGFVGEIRNTVAGPTLGPAPSVGPQLAAIFDRGATSEQVGKIASRPAGTARRRLARVAAMAAGLTFATAGAAAADLLPRAAQDGVAAVVERVTPLDVPDSHDHSGDPSLDPKPAERSNQTGEGSAGKGSPAGVDGIGAGTDPVQSVDVGQGGVGGAVPGSVSPLPDATEGRDSGGQRQGGEPRPATNRGNAEPAPAVQDHRRDSHLPSPSAPAAEDERGTGHRP